MKSNDTTFFFFRILSLYFIFYSIFLIGCSKDGQSQSREKTVEEIIAENAKRNLSVPPIDPSVCENNPEGYIYFQFGEEVFRYTKDSPIKIGLIFPNVEPRLSRKVKNTDIPEGCEGNPYTAIGLQPDFTKNNNPFGAVDFYGFGLVGVSEERYGQPSSGQELRENFFYRLKNTGYCEDLTENMEKCNFKKDGFKEAKNGSFMAKNGVNNTYFDKPFVVECQTSLHIVCDVFYRLYPSIDITYGFHVEKMETKYFLEFDKYIRNIFESMRVKN